MTHSDLTERGSRPCSFRVYCCCHCHPHAARTVACHSWLVAVGPRGWDLDSEMLESWRGWRSWPRGIEGREGSWKRGQFQGGYGRRSESCRRLQGGASQSSTVAKHSVFVLCWMNAAIQPPMYSSQGLIKLISCAGAMLGTFIFELDRCGGRHWSTQACSCLRRVSLL